MNYRYLAIGLAASTVLSGAVSAATMTETYDFTGASDGSFASIDVIGSLGNTVTVTAGNYPLFSNDAVSGADDRVARGNTWGLGAYTNGNESGNHRVDGDVSGEYEALLFAFDYLATATSISFGNYFGDFDIFGNVAPPGENCCNALDDVVDVSGDGIMGTLIGLGAFNGSEFKVRSMTVTYETSPVPLPAAGWMLIAGLGGLAATRRRRTQKAA